MNLGKRYAITAFSIIGLITVYLFIIAINNLMYESTITLRFMVSCPLYGAPFLITAGIIDWAIVQWDSRSKWAKRHDILATLIQFIGVSAIAMIFTIVGFILLDPNNLRINELFNTQYFQISTASTPILNSLILILAKYTAQNRLLRQQEELLLQTENELIKVQYQQLKAQVNPHFLFNTLTVLTSLINTNQAKATQFTRQLAAIYRYLLSTDNNDFVTLAEELKFCTQYADILSIRYGSALKITLPDYNSADNNMQKYVIMPTAIQILIENACKHNMLTSAKPLNITVEIQHSSRFDAKISVTNNIQPRPIPADSTGLGLKGLKQKYKLLTNMDINIRATQATFAVSIPLIKSNVHS